MIEKYIVTMAASLLLSGCATLGLGGASEDAERSEAVRTEKAVAEPSVVEPPQEASDSFVLDGVPTATEAITFESHGAKLAGELVYPQTDGEQPRPGVLIVHDSGPHGRDGIVRGAFGIELPVEVAVYRSLAEALASRGFVVLIWDKRTCLEGGPPWCEYPRSHLDGHVDSLGDVLVDDVKAAFRALKESPRTSDSIHLIGHGHGSELAMVAAETLRPATLVLAAPNAAPPDQMVLRQSERSIEALRARAAEESNADTDAMVKQAEALEKQYDELKEAFSAIRAGKDDDAAGISAKSWRNLIALHSKAQEVIYAPVMVVDAGMDLDVDDEERSAFVARLRADGAEVVSVDELTRPLVSVAQDADPTVVSTEVALRMAKFMAEESR